MYTNIFQLMCLNHQDQVGAITIHQCVVESVKVQVKPHKVHTHLDHSEKLKLSCVSTTLQPVTEVVQPHQGQLAVVLTQDVLDCAKALVHLIEQLLGLGVVRLLRHHVHVVEGEVLELSTQEVVLGRLSRHDVRQLQTVPHTGGPVQADAEQGQEQEDHHRLGPHTYKHRDG